MPAKVQNVRVHVYFPVRSSRELVSAQVVWDGLSVEEAGGMLTSYSINIIDVLMGEPITPTAVFMVNTTSRITCTVHVQIIIHNFFYNF